MLVRPLTRPLVRPLTRRVTQPGFGWSPLALFAASEQGAWYDPSDLSTLYQDSAGTTPVTALGQPVGLMLDKSGRGNHASQLTSTARPTLQQDANGKYYLQFDGVDDGLSTGNIDFTGTDKMTVVAGVHSVVATPEQGVCGCGVDANTLGGFYVSSNGAAAQISTLPVSDRDYVSFPQPSDAPVVLAVAVNKSGADPATRIPVFRANRVQVIKTPTKVGAGASGFFGNLPIHVGRRWTGSTPNPFNGRIYSLIVRGASSTTAQIEAAERYANLKTGAY